jgi:hypothetical protein
MAAENFGVFVNTTSTRTVDGTELAPVVVSSVTKKATVATLRGFVDAGQNVFIGGGGTNVVISVPTPFNGVSGYDNIAIGGLSEDGNGTTAPALAALTTGVSNVCIGNSAGAAITTGDYNTFIGEFAGSMTTTARQNTAIGNYCLQANTTGVNNVAIGSGAVGSNTTASGNVGIGNDALGLNTTGGFNVAIGAAALSQNITGSNNIAIGQTAAAGNLGDNNVAIGTFALSQSTGTGNIAMGLDALQNTTTGSNNIAIGSSAGVDNTTSSSLCWIGGKKGQGSVPLIWAGAIAPADSDLHASDFSVFWDDTNGAANMNIKGKTANGTVVTQSVPLSGTLAKTSQIPSAANPSATIGTSATNGSAATFMRSDAAPALASTISAAGPIGSSSVVPVLTYNAAGQLTTVTTATITPAAIGAAPSAGSSSIVTVGTLTGGMVNPQYGGTGVVNNSANTLTFSGNFGLTLTLSGTTSLTLPTSGTLATTAQTGLPRGYWSGCELSNNTAQAVTIQAGSWRDNTNTYNLVLASSITKVFQASGNWSAGNAGNLNDSGGFTNAGYHIFLIYNPTILATDVIATRDIGTVPPSPSLPTGYTAWRRIGYQKISGGTLLAMRQVGNRFSWAAPVASAGNPITVNNAQVAITHAGVPNGVIVDADSSYLYACTTTANVAFYDAAASGSSLGAGQGDLYLPTPSQDIAGRIRIQTTTGQLTYTNTASNISLYVWDYGWWEYFQATI